MATRVWNRRAVRPPIHAPRAERRISPGLLLTLLLGLALGIAIAWGITWQVQNARTKAAVELPGLPGIPGRPIPAYRGPIVVMIPAAGVTVPARQAKLAPRQPGVLKEISVKPGESVKAGQVVARVDASKLETKLAEAKSQQRSAQLKLEQLKAGARPEEVVQAEANVQGAQAKLSDLVAGAPAPDLAAAQSQADAAAATLRSAQARVDALTGGKAPEPLRQAAQDTTALQNDVRKAEADLAKLTTGGSIDDQKVAQQAVLEAERAVARQTAGKNLACAKVGTVCETAKAALTAAQATLTQAQTKLSALRTPATQTEVDAAQAKVDQARKALAQASSGVSQAQSGNVVNPNEIREAQSALETATANHQAAQAKVDAVRQGPKQGEVQAAQSALVGAQANLALKRAPASPQDIGMAEEQVNRADLAVRDAQQDLDSATLIAPFDGVVSNVTAAIGDQVGPTPVLALMDPNSAWIETGLDDVEVRRVAVGSPARVTFEALSERVYSGKITSVATEPIMQNSVPRFAVTIGLDDRVLPRPGTAAEVQLLVGQKENALLVPARAVARVGSERLVVVLGGAKPEARPVKLGLRTEDIVEVLEGVREGEQVISPAPQSLLTPQRLDSAIPTAVPIPIPSRQVPVRG